MQQKVDVELVLYRKFVARSGGKYRLSNVKRLISFRFIHEILIPYQTGDCYKILNKWKEWMIMTKTF